MKIQDAYVLVIFSEADDNSFFLCSLNISGTVVVKCVLT